MTSEVTINLFRFGDKGFILQGFSQAGFILRSFSEAGGNFYCQALTSKQGMLIYLTSCCFLQTIILGVFSGRVTPDSIPNSAVKPVSADGSPAFAG